MLPKILAVVGPTAAGKTDLSVALAKRFAGEVISFDSMQVYRGLTIASAKPDEQQRRGVAHHLFDLCDTDCSFSVAAYVPLAETAVRRVLQRGAIPIFCGGTGLYLDAFLRGQDAFAQTQGDETLRNELYAIYETEGIDPLYRRLCQLDPVGAAAIHPNNTRRVIRALEIYLSTGRAKSEWDACSKAVPARYNVLKIGIAFRQREHLWERIAARTDAMFAKGLWEEIAGLQARGLLPQGCTAAQAIGCKEILNALSNGGSVTDARDQIIIATRQYAKRQMTWFGRDSQVHWLYADEYASTDALTVKAEELVTRFLSEEVCDAE